MLGSSPSIILKFLYQGMEKLRAKNRSEEERQKFGATAQVMFECELCCALFQPNSIQLPKDSGGSKSDRGMMRNNNY